MRSGCDRCAMLYSVRQLDASTAPGIWEVEIVDGVRVLLHLEHGVVMFRRIPCRRCPRALRVVEPARDKTG